MTAGRPKVPQAMKDARGTSRPDRTNPDAPVVRVAPPPRPTFLDSDPQAAELYDVAVNTLMKMQVVGEPDSLALSLLADQLSSYLKMRKVVEEEGLTILSAQGVQKTHPLLQQMNTAYGNIYKMLIQYGLTAATRQNVSSAPLDGTAEESFDKFLDK